MTTRLFLLLFACFIFVQGNSQNQVAAYLSHTDSMEVTPIKGVNSFRYKDMHPSLSPEGDVMYFASERGGKSWSYPYMDTRSDSNVFYLSDLWRSKREGSKWSKPECLPFGLNSSKADHSPIIDKDGLYHFSWDGEEEVAKLLSKKNGDFVKFHWMHLEDGSFLEFRLKTDPLTRDLALMVTYFVDEDEEEEAQLLWDNQIEELLHVLGS